MKRNDSWLIYRVICNATEVPQIHIKLMFEKIQGIQVSKYFAFSFIIYNKSLNISDLRVIEPVHLFGNVLVYHFISVCHLINIIRI